MVTPRLLRAYAGPLILLLLASVVLSTSAALGTAIQRAGGDLLVLLPVAVLGVVTMTVLSLDLAWRRRPDLVLARLRGVRGIGAVRVAAGPATTAVITGGVLGMGLAGIVAARPPDGWVVPMRLGSAEIGAIAATTAVSLLVVAIGSLAVLRVPCAPTAVHSGREQLTPDVLVRVGGIGLVVLSVVALSRADQPSAAASAVVLAGSAVLGLASGQLLVWVRHALTAVVGSRRSTSSLLGLRRAGSADHSARLRLVVAAAVVAAAAWSGSAATGSWALEADALRVGAPVQVKLPDTSALDTWLLTRTLDPEARWLMAAAVSDDRTEAAKRFAYLDLERYDRVAGDALAETSGDVADATSRLRDAPRVQVVTGSRLVLEARFDPGAAGGTASRRIRFAADYLGDEGFVQRVSLRLRPTTPGGTSLSGEQDVVACERACVLLAVVAIGPSSPSPRLAIDRFQLDGTDLVGEGWVDLQADADASPTRTLDFVSGYLPVDAKASQPVLTAGSPTWSDEGPRAPGIGGTDRPLVEVGSRPALPLLLGAGLLGDLPVALAGSRSSVSGVTSIVLARADTPPEVMAGLEDAGAQPPVVPDPAGEAELGPAASGEQRLRQVVAAAGAALALLGLIGASSSLGRASRRDAAALRLVGVGASTRRGASLVEAGVLGAGVSAATAVGGWIAVIALTEKAPLTPTGPTLLPPPGAFDASLWGVVVLGAAGAWIVSTLVARRERRTTATPVTTWGDRP